MFSILDTCNLEQKNSVKNTSNTVVSAVECHAQATRGVGLVTFFTHRILDEECESELFEPLVQHLRHLPVSLPRLLQGLQQTRGSFGALLDLSQNEIEVEIVFQFTSSAIMARLSRRL